MSAYNPEHESVVLPIVVWLLPAGRINCSIFYPRFPTCDLLSAPHQHS